MTLSERFEAVRGASEQLCEPLTPEDCGLQSMTDASPVKWHLAHTTWFFETLVLEPSRPDFKPFDPAFRMLFNSYYNAVGEQYARPQRGLLSRPGLDEVLAYRRNVNLGVLALLDDPRRNSAELNAVIELGLHHEQQHQELILTDVKHALSHNPLRPAYQSHAPTRSAPAAALSWYGYDEGVRRIGHDGSGFAFDNERPRHRVFVEAFELASRPVTNTEYLAFIEDRGYEQPRLWLSDGWEALKGRGWRSPLYWERQDDAWTAFTLAGQRPLVLEEPVCHVSYYEADAFARWAGARLPGEAEWECAAADARVEGNFVESGRFQPAPTPEANGGPAGLFGDVWEWTRSAYAPYPGFRPPTGALGEYNGKFMSNQLVLRGGSCATPRSQIRASYRNFFYPDARWQFSGIRLARDTG